MANQRDKSKKLLGFYASPEEKKAIEAIAKARGISVAELLRGIALGTIKVGIIVFALFHLCRTPADWSRKALLATGNAILFTVPVPDNGVAK